MEDAMSIAREKKVELIKGYAVTGNDTGSPEVQCAVLTERVLNLTEHLKINKKDFQSRRGLLMLVGRRRKLLKYLKSKNEQRYQDLIKRLNLRK
jgi:small subunit ribosomal protein S15